MSILFQDLRYAFRMLLKRPGFTGVIVVTLALGIGANTAIFSVVDSVVLRPLPFEDPGQLTMVLMTGMEEDSGRGTTWYPEFADIRKQSNSFEELAIFRNNGCTLTGTGAPERVEGGRVSAGFFPLLHVQPALGRLFRAEDNLHGAENVVVISHEIWQRSFGGNGDALGKALTVDGTACTVVGVLPVGFSFPVSLSEAEIWTPTALDEDFKSNRQMQLARMVGRRRSGVTLEEAQAEMDTIARRLEQQHPETSTGRRINLVSLHEHVVGDVRPAALVLLGAVGLVLLIACANVANLLLVRSAGREQELAIRTAVGAGRERLLRQLLTESGSLAAIGGGLGLVVATWGTSALIAVMPDDIPRTGQIALDGRVLIFVLAISMITGLGFGLLPALNASQSGWHAAMKEGGRTTAGVRRRRLRNSLVVCEVALALVLLIGAGLMLRSFHRLMQVDCGFDPSSVLTFRMSIPFSAYTDPVPRARLYNEVVERLESLPGVKSAGAAAILPLRGTMIGLTFEILGRPAPPPGEEPVVRSNSVTVDYFRTMGMALQRGRFFTELDTRDAPAVTIINETMVRQFWPDEDPIGQRIAPAVVLGDHDPDSYEIVGIVADVRANAVDVAARPCMYIPNEQQTWPFMTFAVRTTVDPSTLIGAVRGEIASVTKDEAAFDFKTMEQYTSEAVGDRRFPMFLLGLFAVLALILAAMGMYATLSYSVAQRTHEIGVRVAIGAQRSDVLRLIVKQGLVLTISGLGIGLLASLALARVLSSQLYEIGAADPVTFAGVSLLLTAVALLACYIPARRATKVDPMVALRCE